MTKLDAKFTIELGEFMKTKEKNRNNGLSVKKRFFYCIACTIILLIGILIYTFTFHLNQSYAETVSEVEDFQISKANLIEIDKVIQENQGKKIKEEFYQEEEILEYITKYQVNPEVPKGISYVIQEGRQGKQIITKMKTYEEKILVKEEMVSSKVTKASFNKIIEVGGNEKTSNHKVKIGEEVFVTTDRLPLYLEPNEESNRLMTLSKNDKVKVNQITQNFYQVEVGKKVGFIKQECTTYFSKETPNEEQEGNISKQQLLAKLDFNMKLNEPSGFTLEQFKKVLKDDKDKNAIFEKQAEYFYYIEKQYQINGIFVASVGVHESAWGTSQIAREKYNLFGYGAYDQRPYESAYHFSDYSESIDLVARVFAKYYLNPKGTSIYGGEVAIGNYYNGPTLSGVNQKYATDNNWSKAVYSYMKYFYNKL